VIIRCGIPTKSQLSRRNNSEIGEGVSNGELGIANWISGLLFGAGDILALWNFNSAEVNWC
ncbi:hypothetical protein U1Q18_020828, partial [Sarracenia purpurea var. burkii]